ncbi:MULTISPECIES: polymerase [unclassified Streptococcus]|jgi:polymerase for repeating unit of receptor polysaccharide|uniref:polymerase n=2 Tax=Bacillati TaxID=1783272 RepID=UPI0012BB81BC|nr:MULTISPECIES: polymerase [unclassified Streptococcus]
MTVVMNNRFISEKFYLFTLFIWVVVASLVTTTYFVRLDGFLSLYRLLLYFTIIMLLIKELMNFPKTLYYFRFHWQQLLIVTAFFIAMFIVAKNRDGLLDINVLLLVFSARDIDFRKLLGTFSVATFLVLCLTIYASQKGMITNMFMNADGGYRFSLGFNYVSFASQRLFFALCTYLMFRGKRISYLELLALLLATIYMYQQTSTSSPFYLSILILTYALLSIKIFKKEFIIGNFLSKALAQYGFIVALAVILYFCFYSSGNLFHLVDQFTHNRLRLSVDGFRNFGVSWLGQPISFTTLDMFGNFTSNYNYIDSSFVQLLVIDGLIVSAFMLFALTKVMKYFISIQKDIVLACLGIMIIHGMFDPQMLVLRYSPLILFISRLFIMNPDNKIE